MRPLKTAVPPALLHAARTIHRLVLLGVSRQDEGRAHSPLTCLPRGPTGQRRSRLLHSPQGDRQRRGIHRLDEIGIKSNMPMLMTTAILGVARERYKSSVPLACA